MCTRGPYCVGCGQNTDPVLKGSGTRRVLSSHSLPGPLWVGRQLFCEDISCFCRIFPFPTILPRTVSPGSRELAGVVVRYHAVSPALFLPGQLLFSLQNPVSPQPHRLDSGFYSHSYSSLSHMRSVHIASSLCFFPSKLRLRWPPVPGTPW